MPGINQATVGDGYTAAATVQDVFTSTGGWFAVSSQPVVLQLQWGPNSSGSRWSDEQTLGAGAFGTIPAGCTGIRFRNLVAGSAATVTAYIGEGGSPPDPRGNVWPEPALAISALGLVTTSGKAPTRTVITAPGAGTYNTPTNCGAIMVECFGGGGGGGSASATAAGQWSNAGGGGGGAYASAVIPSPAASWAYSVGAGGAGGTLGGTGSPGTGTTFGAGPSVSAGGGLGGLPTGATAATAAAPGGAGGTPAVGSVQLQGSPGAGALAIFNAALLGNEGGAAPRGGGGAASQTVNHSTGNAGSAGGGGSGCLNGGSQPAAVGGKGGDGLIIVTEFY